MIVRSALVLGALVAPSAAFAAACEPLIARAASAEGADLVAAWDAVHTCDAAAAGTAFPDFVRAAKDVETASALALKAIDRKAYVAVWTMPDLVKDYEQRDAIVKAVGAACPEHPEVVTFLQGAYFGLRSNQFVKWEPAIGRCQSEALDGWLETTSATPPKSTYDEKYAAVIHALVLRKRAGALPTLQRAAVEAAGSGGPFTLIIEKMNEAVLPVDVGGDVAPADKAALEQALVNVANAVAPEQAALVADRLFNSGAVSAAASLLPRVYPNRVQPDGKLLYGVVSVESCDGQAVLHTATVSEAAKRWSIQQDVEGPARAFKPRLKCPPGEPWPVIITAEPLTGPDALQPWVDAQVQTWTQKGLTVKTRAESTITLN